MRLGRLRMVLVVLVVLLAAASPMIAPVLAQENNSTSAGGNGTDSGIGGDSGASNSTPAGNSSGNATNNSSGNNSYEGPYRGRSDRAQEIRENKSSGSSSEGEQAYGSGYLSDVTGNTSQSENGTVRYGNNSSANGSGMNGTASGLSSDADGVKGTAINAALDVFARILKFISNAIGGAMTFILKKVIGAMTWTPHPPRNDSYQAAINASNSTFWGQQFHTYDTVWRPFALVAAIFLTVIYALGSSGYTDLMPANIQQKGWLHLGIAWIMCTDASWVLISMVLDGAGLATQALLQTVEINAGFVGGGALVIVALLLYYLLGFWMVLAMMFIYGMRIVLMIALTPAIPMLFVARAVPIQTLSRMADSLLKFWGYLAILPIPVVATLAIGFGMDFESMLSGTGLLGSIGAGFLGLAVHTGTILAAIILPYLLYQRSGASNVMGVVGAVSPDDMEESYEDQEKTVERRREQAKIDLPDRVQNMAVRATNVFINAPNGMNDYNNRPPNNGGGGSRVGTRDEIYVKSEQRRKQLEE